MKVTIDPYAGFCFGVKNTIEIAEKELQKQEKLYCIGDIVHNQEEIDRLGNLGLEITDFESLPKEKDTNVLFRAHGEPPSSYIRAKENGLKLIDGTCSIVLKLQQKIKAAYNEMRKIDGQIVIFGKKNHPEVIGLSGYTEDNAIIIGSIDEIDQIDFGKPIRLFAQTTKDKKLFKSIQESIYNRAFKINATPDYKFFNTICGQVSNRVPKLKDFCKRNDIIVFISGKKSSNGNYLFNICKLANPNSYYISSINELKPEWLTQTNTVGISGATSTPIWLLEEVASKIVTLK